MPQVGGLDNQDVAPGFQKYIKADSKYAPPNEDNLLNRGAKHVVEVVPGSGTAIDMNDPIHKRTTEGVHQNAQAGGKGTWAPSSTAEANKLSDQLADKTTDILKNLSPMPGQGVKRNF